LKGIVQPEVYEKIINISDQLLQAVIGYTFDCFADMLADQIKTDILRMKKWSCPYL
jgi:hypothetical protein